MRKSIFCIILAITRMGTAQMLDIVTVDSPQRDVLKAKTEEIAHQDLADAWEIAGLLYLALEPHFPAAGLAAPQIGISKSVFIYTFDRDPNNLEVVINPHFTPIGDAKIVGWEGCLSVMLSNGIWKLAKIPRYESIQVEYLDLEGKKVKRTLTGFAAKVFQHEYDHLQGIENIDREDAVVLDFASKEEMLLFMAQVKKEDSIHYYKK